MIYLNDAPVPAQHQASVRSIPAALAKPASFTHPKQADRPDITVPSIDAAPAKQEACQQPPQQPELIVLDDSSHDEMPEQASLGRNKAAANPWQHVPAQKHISAAKHSTDSSNPSTGSRAVVKQESCTQSATDTGKLQATHSPHTPARLYHQQPQLSGLGQTAMPPSQGAPTHKRKLEQMQHADDLGAGGKPAQPSQGAPTLKRKLEEMQQADNLGAGGKPAQPSQGAPVHKRKLEEMQQADNLDAVGKSARHAAASGLPQLRADSETSAVRASTISSGSLQLKAKSGASVTLPSTLASSTSAVKGTPLTSQDIAQTFAVVVATLAILYGYDANDLIATCIAMCSSGCSKSALTNVMVPLVLSAVCILVA